MTTTPKRTLFQRIVLNLTSRNDTRLEAALREGQLLISNFYTERNAA